jgi:hypothetical protein
MALLLKTVRLLHEASEVLNDSRYGITTAGWIPQAQAGVHHPDANAYAATPYRVIRRVFKQLPPRCLEGAFIDYGSGRGRVAMMAALYSFRRVIGIEISEVLHRQAQQNLSAIRAGTRCAVQLVRTDATQFQVPDDATAAYFYKPFGRSTTIQVLHRLKESLHRNPRELWVLGYNAHLLVDLASEHLSAQLVSRGTTIYPSIEWAALHVHPK